MHVPLFDLDEHEADLEPSDTETESPLNYEAITNRKTLNQLYKLYWDSLETEQYDGCSPSFIFREAEKSTGRNKFHFLFSLLGNSVNLANVWRFPYLAYSHGGGAFLIPFVIMLLVIGFPMLFMELALGQFSNLGPLGTHDKMCPLFQGIGYSMVLISVIVSIYYNIVIAWSIFYMFASFTSSLPWKYCNQSWSSSDCCDAKSNHCLWHNASLNQSMISNTSVMPNNITINITAVSYKTATHEYFENVVLDISQGLENVGKVHWPIALSLLFAWFLVFLSTCRGIKFCSKVACVTVPFSCIVLFTVFIRAVSLQGAKDGIIVYFKPEFARLATAKIWVDAAVQTFYSLGPILGGLITFSSHSVIHNDCFKDTIIMFIFSSLTSIFTGLTLFSALGFVADQFDMDIHNMANKGVGFIFNTFPEIVLQLPTSPVWSFLVFAMLLLVGINSQMAVLGSITSAVLETMSFLRGKRTIITLLLCILGFFLGILLCTQGGYHIIQLLDYYTARWGVLLLAVMECIVIGWIYGSDRFLRDIEIMIGPRRISWHWYFTLFWKFLTPVTLTFLLIMSWVQFEPVQIDGYIYPRWAHVVGCCISLLPVLIVFVFAGVKFTTAGHPMSFTQRVKHCLSPTLPLGPAHHAPDIAAALNRMSTEPLKSKNSFENPTYNVVYTFETNM